MIEIHFSWYVENVRLFLSQKSQFELEEKIKNKIKNCTRASLIQSSEDGKQEIFFYVALRWKNELNFMLFLYLLFTSVSQKHLEHDSNKTRWLCVWLVLCVGGS